MSDKAQIVLFFFHLSINPSINTTYYECILSQVLRVIKLATPPV